MGRTFTFSASAGSAQTIDLGAGEKFTISLADASTTQAPDVLVLGHVTSETAANGFGATEAVELESAGGTKRRVMTRVTSLVDATNASEDTQHVIQLMKAGALANALTLTADQMTVPAGTGIATPGLLFAGSAHGFFNNGANTYLATSAGTYAWSADSNVFQVTATLGLEVGGGMFRINRSADTVLMYNAANTLYFGFDGATGAIGWFPTKAAAPATQQTVTGSRGGNAALASLLTALANYGLVIDSSSA